MSKTIYLTTPLYYVNASPHIGHSYTSVAADCLSRFYRMNGRQVFLLTGTDEHGQKIEQAAAASGKSPQAFVDEVVERFRSLWTTLEISYDDFIRTTQPNHVQAVQAILTRLHDEGKLKRATYEGWYCTPCETFWTAEELKQTESAGQVACASCGRPVEQLQEDGWHLPLRPYQGWLKSFVKAHPAFVRPESRYNELFSLLQEPLPESLCITRPIRRVGWGIPVPFSPAHVTYVWFDALLNYISVPGYPTDLKRFSSLWPVDVHLIGKDILRHHAVYWPIILHTLGFSDEQLPKMIFAHGWWKIGEQKMSKSLGNIVDPSVVVGQFLKDQPYASDVYRYFLLREVPFGQDGNFSEDAIRTRLESDLANDLGNLLHRSLSMIARYCEGRIPVFSSVGCAEDDVSMQETATGLWKLIPPAMERLEFSNVLEAVMQMVSQANRHIESQAPWQLHKAGQNARLGSVLRVAAEVLRVSAIALEPFMPLVSSAIWQQLGCGELPRRFEDVAKWPVLVAGQQIGSPQVLFPRTPSPSARSLS